MKKCVALLCAVALICLWGCGGPADASPAATTENLTPMVGIALPEETERFAWEGQLIRTRLESAGFAVILEYAQQDAALQTSQVERMMSLGADCLIVTAVDPLPLADVLQQAENKGVPVIAYDRGLFGCEGVDLYIGFDGYAAGAAMGRYVIDKMQLDTAQQEQRSHTVEFFMGAPEDSNALARHEGVMSVLKPYLDSGVLLCLSGRVSFEDSCTALWSSETAQADCQRYLSKYYEEQPLEICIAGSDNLAGGCVKALEIAKVENMPLIVGQEVTLDSARRIAAGTQAMSALYDYEPVALSCIEAATALLAGQEIQTNGSSGGVKAQLFQPVTVNTDNYQSQLIDSGLYTKDQLGVE